MQLSQLLQCTPKRLLYLTLLPLGLHVVSCWSLREMQQGEPARSMIRCQYISVVETRKPKPLLLQNSVENYKRRE